MAGTKNLYGVILKYPVPGMVKTRLAREIGEENATEIYREVADSVLRQTQPEAGGYERVIFFAPRHMRPQFEKWIPGERLFPQSSGDIGEVMADALQGMFGDGASKAVITGADIPGLDSGMITRAFSELDGSDVVIGPAEDGGYYLIGMKSALPQLFLGPSWGTGLVLQQTLSIIDRMNLRLSTLVALADLDRPEDFLRYENSRRRRA